MLAGGRKGEVVAITNKRGQERGLVKENEDMSIEDMVRQERRTKGQAGGEGMLLAEKIAKDAKFDVSFQYIDSSIALNLTSTRTISTILTRTLRSSPPAPLNPPSIFASAAEPLETRQRLLLALVIYTSA